MQKLPTKQSGFSTVEVVLVLVVVAIIGFAGWFVWQSKQNNKNSGSKATSQTTSSQKDTAETSQDTNKLTITEWDVALSTEKAVPITYTILTPTGANYPTAYLSTASLDASKTCQEYYAQGKSATYIPPASFQGISRLALTDETSLDEGVTVITAAQAAEQSPERYKKVGQYVYWYHHGNGMPCSEQTAEQSTAFSTAFTTITEK